MAEPTKDELRKEIAVILKDANLEETAAKKVRLQLEANLKCDLSARKKEVDDLVMEYVNAQDESEGEEEEEDDEEEEETPKKKAAGKKKKKDESEDEEEEEDEEDDEDDAPKKKGKRGAAPAKRGAPAKKKKGGSDSEEESEEEGSDDDYKPNKGAKGSAKKGGRKKKAGSESDSDEDWKSSKAKGKKGAGAKKGGGGKSTGYTRPYNLSPELAAICGADALPRHEVVKKVWAIIKERNLYDPKNKQYAICDSELQKVIGVKRFRTFGMLKYLKAHFLD